MNDKTWAGRTGARCGSSIERINLPSGLSIHYDKLHRTSDGEWSYFYGKEQRWRSAARCWRTSCRRWRASR